MQPCRLPEQTHSYCPTSPPKQEQGWLRTFGRLPGLQKCRRTIRRWPSDKNAECKRAAHTCATPGGARHPAYGQIAIRQKNQAPVHLVVAWSPRDTVFSQVIPLSCTQHKCSQCRLSSTRAGTKHFSNCHGHVTVVDSEIRAVTYAGHFEFPTARNLKPHYSFECKWLLHGCCEVLDRGRPRQESHRLQPR